jgi:hypothetical protein
MCAELSVVHGPGSRWRFSLGCSRVALALRWRASLAAADRGGDAVRGLVIVAVVGSLGLAAYGLVRYPGLRDGAQAWVAVGVLVVLLGGYAAGGLALCRGTTPAAVKARAYGVVGGVTVGCAWLMILAPAELAKQLVVVPLLAALVVPAAVAIAASRALGDARLATAAALWSGLIGGLLVFIVWVTATYARDGRPYDPQLVRDFHASGAHDLATFAVSDDLGAALGLLVIVPLVALALGSLVARWPRGERRSSG